MAGSPRKLTLGGELRRARTSQGFSLDQLARRIQKTKAYLSDIELNRRTPAETVMVDLARELGLDFDRLMALGARLGEETEVYLKEHPLAVELVRRLARADLGDDQLRQLLASIDAQVSPAS